MEEKNVYKINDFEGPLDLLLFLIKKNEMNIYDIQIASITEQFIDFLTKADKSNLANITDFYEMASDLLYIKSRMLLPIKVEIEEDELEDPRQELVDKLIEYQRLKKLAQLMETKIDESEWCFERKDMQRFVPYSEPAFQFDRADTFSLMKTYSSLVSVYNSEKILNMYESITVNEKVSLMTELLEKNGKCFFTDLITRKGNLLDVVCAFMAVLESAKFKMTSIYQKQIFGNILIKPCNKE